MEQNELINRELTLKSTAFLNTETAAWLAVGIIMAVVMSISFLLN